MKKDKDCRGSVRFAATDEKAPVRNIYIDRVLANDWTEVTVTVSNPTKEVLDKV